METAVGLRSEETGECPIPISPTVPIKYLRCGKYMYCSERGVSSCRRQGAPNTLRSGELRCRGEGSKILRNTVEGEAEAPPLVREWPEPHRKTMDSDTRFPLGAVGPTAIGKGIVLQIVLHCL